MDVPQLVDAFFGEGRLGCLQLGAVLSGWSCQSWRALWSC